MISKTAEKFALFFADKNIYKYDQIDIYKYGFELLLSTILNMAGVITTSLFMGVLLESLLFFLAFIPLRVTAGGYHAKHHWSCFLTMNITFLLITITLKYMSSKFMISYIIIGTIISGLIIWLLSPVEAVNKPLSETKKIKQREKSLLIAAIDIILVIIFIHTVHLQPAFISFYISGMFAASMSLVAAVITSPKNNKDRDV